MVIQWFPGHMTKARKNIQDLTKEIDIVIELLDARAPLSSSNPLIKDIIKFKRTIRLLNKSDLADETITLKWVNFFKQDTVVITGRKDNKNQRMQLIKLCESMAPNRNSFEKPLRVMITGIPNVGKSTLINQLIGQKSAKTGDIPAVTKANQCLNLRDDFLIYDTPGITWENLEYEEVGSNLAICNSIGRNAFDYESLALYLIEYLSKAYPSCLITRYRLNENALELTNNQLLNLIGKKRGCLTKGGIIDIQKVSELIVQDFRDGNLGKISLESPE